MLDLGLVDRVDPLFHLGGAVGLDGKSPPWSDDDKDACLVFNDHLCGLVNVPDIDDAEELILFAILVVCEFGRPEHEPLFLPNLSQPTENMIRRVSQSDLSLNQKEKEKIVVVYNKCLSSDVCGQGSDLESCL